ncbi:UNVERIFIED_CONTAM: hypothetical protein K2H54_061937 [Gekko kuhli]
MFFLQSSEESGLCAGVLLSGGSQILKEDYSDLEEEVFVEDAKETLLPADGTLRELAAEEAQENLPEEPQENISFPPEQGESEYPERVASLCPEVGFVILERQIMVGE